MEKVKIKIENKINEVILDFDGQEVVILDQISLENYLTILDVISTNIMSISSYMGLELVFKKMVLELLSNIDVNELNEVDYFNIDFKIDIENIVKNYKSCLDKIKSEYQAQIISISLMDKIDLKGAMIQFEDMMKNLDDGKFEKLQKVILTNASPLLAKAIDEKKGVLDGGDTNK